MTESEAEKFIEAKAKEALKKWVVQFLTILGIVNIGGFYAMWQMAKTTSQSIAENAASRATEVAINGQKALVDDINKRLGTQSVELDSNLKKIALDEGALRTLETDITAKLQKLQEIGADVKKIETTDVAKVAGLLAVLEKYPASEKMLERIKHLEETANKLSAKSKSETSQSPLSETTSQMTIRNARSVPAPEGAERIPAHKARP